MLTTVKIDHPYCFWENLFNDSELENIIQYCEKSEMEKGFISNGIIDENIRKSNLSWIFKDNQNQWFFNKLSSVANKINSRHFGFDIYDIDSMQYTLYDEEGSHYDWHWDMYTLNNLDNSIGVKQRKLSLVLQLSDPTEYEGGDLQLSFSGVMESIKKEKGYITIFPSFLTHKVTPVESGVRRTLVAWFTGPDWR